MNDVTPGLTTGRDGRGRRAPAVVAMGILLGVCWLAFLRTDPADGVARESVHALEGRSRTQHEQMLADTQALANELEGLVQLNAERAAEIATLTSELAKLRSEVASLRRGCQ